LKTIRTIISFLIVAAVSFVIGGCSDNDEWNEQTGGGIQLSIPGISTEISETRSTPAELPTPPIADFHVTIVRMSNGVTIYDGPFTSEKITAAPDDYSITCSYGLNAILDYDSPYYSGTVTATVVSTTEPTPVSVPVKVANSLVSVQFGDTEENIARFDKFYSDYALRVHVGDHFIDLNKDNTSSSIYVAAGSQATLSFWGKLRAQNDREVTCELQSSSFPSTVKAAEHYIVTLSLPDPESALVVDIAKVELQTATLEETIPLSWLPVPKVEAKHHYESGVLTGTDLTFSNSYPGMSWKAVVTNAAGTVVRTVEGTGALSSLYTDDTWPYLPQGNYKATYSIVGSDGNAKEASQRGFTISAPTISVKADGYTSYSKYLEGEIDAANELDGHTIYKPAIRLSVSESLLKNNKYSYSFSYTYDGTKTNVSAGKNSLKISDMANQKAQIDAHILRVDAAFDGATATTQKEFIITGLPYSIDFEKQDEWAISSGVTWSGTDVQFGLNSTGSQSITTTSAVCIPMGTYFCADYSVMLHPATGGTTFSIVVGTQTILSIQEKGINHNDVDHKGSTGVFHEDNQYLTTITCSNSYGAAQTRSKLYLFCLKYANH